MCYGTTNGEARSVYTLLQVARAGVFANNTKQPQLAATERHLQEEQEEEQQHLGMPLQQNDALHICLQDAERTRHDEMSRHLAS